MMEHLALWVNVATFAAFGVALALAVVAHLRRPLPWMGSYLTYHAAYALWLLVLTYSFFAAAYLPRAPHAVAATAAALRLLVSAVILWSYPGLVMGISDAPAAGALRRLRLVAVATILAPSAVLVSLGASPPALGLLNILFNASLLGVSVFALLTLHPLARTAYGGVLRPFLWVSAAFYTYALIAGCILVGWGISSATVAALSGALYCLPWSLAVAVATFRHLTSAPQPSVSSELIAAFGLTPREAEIVNLVIAGRPNKEIAKACAISLRTVETHLRNVFRKCDVRSRTELAHLVRSGL